MIRLEYKRFKLKTKDPFGTAHGIRLHTDCVLIRIHHKGHIGHGEASLPPYYPETQDSVISFIESFDVSRYNESDSLERILSDLNMAEGNFAAKCAIDVALHDVFCKAREITVSQLYFDNIESTQLASSFTIGTDELSVMIDKTKEASVYDSLKIKLTGKQDIQVIEAIRSITDQPLLVDANQSWKSIDEAIEKSILLRDLGVILIEQPFATGNWVMVKHLKTQSALPIYADEDVKSITDIEQAANCYDGINIKIMKCGGIFPGIQMLQKAKSINLGTMIGCMTETSCTISASSHLANEADYLDLDGHILLSNDPYESARVDRLGHLHMDSKNVGIGMMDYSQFWH